MRNSNNTTSPQTIASKRAWSIFFANKTKKRKKPNFVCVSKAKQAIKLRKQFLTAINDLSKPMTRKTWEYSSLDMDP